jgi:hypothetical protein
VFLGIFDKNLVQGLTIALRVPRFPACVSVKINERTLVIPHHAVLRPEQIALKVGVLILQKNFAQGEIQPKVPVVCLCDHLTDLDVQKCTNTAPNF